MFDLAMPWVLLLLPLPYFIKRFAPTATVLGSTALKIPFYQKLYPLTSKPSHAVLANRTKQILAYTAWCLLILAISGPQWLGESIEISRSGRNLMLAIDISGSMELPDMNRPDISRIGLRDENRLDVVKVVASKFIDRRAGDRIGLILFGTKAYLQTPLTFDRETVQSMLEDASIGLAGKQTAIGDAIGLAVKRLRQFTDESRALVLLTDGVNNAGSVPPLEAAQLAAKAGIRIYTIGIGADKFTINGLLGSQVVNPSSDLDEDTLKQIAKLTNGIYFRAKDIKSLESVYHAVDKLEPITTDPAIFRPITPLYPWPLALVLLISALLATNYAGLKLYPLHFKMRGL